MTGYRLLVVDLDGTTLDHDHKLDPVDIKAIAEAKRKHGLLMSVATGRMFKAAYPYAKALGANVPLICYEGAAIVSLDGEFLYEDFLSFERAVEVANYFKDNGISCIMYRDEIIFVENETKWTQFYTDVVGFPATKINSFEELSTDKGIPKVVGVCDKICAQNKVKELRELFWHKVTATLSLPEFIEVTAPGVNKAKALGFLLDYLDIPPEAVIAIGDSYNDFEIVSEVGVGAVVDTAPQEVKEKAKIIAPALGGSPVMYVLKQCGLI
jgi:Cof subfamily protein (haloacid dehalogenase superfamily)